MIDAFQFLAVFGIDDIIYIAIALASATAGVVSSQQSAQAQEDAARANAAAQRDRAQQEQETAAENARRREKEAKRMVAAQRAALASRGLSMEGTPLAVLGEEYTQAQQDVADIGYEAESRARAFQHGAAVSIADGENQAAATRASGYGKALGTATRAASEFRT